jgi:hydrogenase nickel incorporation protein HypB
MCKECGCEDKEKKGKKTESIQDLKREIVSIDKSITEHNDNIAHDIWRNLRDKGVLCVNIMGSPGSGKTSFIEGIAKHISPEEIMVIQGDLESDVDKERLEKIGIDAHQINTHSGCHLNSEMIKEALAGCNLDGKKYLMIENVGNLVCPSGVKIGQHMNVLISSTTEGSDKPRKYPYIFMDAGIIVISKIDIADAVDFDEGAYIADIKRINPAAKIFKASRKISGSFDGIAQEIIHEREHLTGTSHNH